MDDAELETKDVSGIFIPVVVLIVFIIFLGIMGYLLVSSGFQTTGPISKVSTDNRTVARIFSCPPGQCATDIFSGVKTCPQENEAMFIDPRVSVCNSRYVCDNNLTPFAQQSNGSTSIDGVCEPNVQCGCLRHQQCAEYILSAFTVADGNVYLPTQGQRITFPQLNSYATSEGGSRTTATPIQYNNSRTFCSVPISWLPLSTPGCNFFSASQINNMSLDEIVLCQGMISGCSGMLGSPCLQGVLAAITEDPDGINENTLITTQFGCVRGEPCPCGQLAIFDTKFGGVICKDVG